MDKLADAEQARKDMILSLDRELQDKTLPMFQRTGLKALRSHLEDSTTEDFVADCLAGTLGIFASHVQEWLGRKIQV